MNQAVAFGALFGGGILLVSALTDSSLGDVVKGKAGHVSTTGSILAGATSVAGGAASAASNIASSVKGAFNKAQLEALWVQAGGNPAAAGTAAAIALAESSGDPHSNLVTSAEDSRGLWQINTYAHPEYSGQNLYDPLANAKAAIRVSNNGSNWGPWSTYTSGKYRQFL